MPSARSATAAPRRSPRTLPPQPRRQAPKRPQIRVRWDRLGRIGLLIVLTIVVGLYLQRALSYFSSRAQAKQQLSVVHNLVRENAQLERQQSSLGNQQTIVSDARALGMVWPGERPYVVVGLPDH